MNAKETALAIANLLETQGWFACHGTGIILFKNGQQIPVTIELANQYGGSSGFNCAITAFTALKAWEHMKLIAETMCNQLGRSFYTDRAHEEMVRFNNEQIRPEPVIEAFRNVASVLPGEGLPVAGYRPQSQENIDAVNRNKYIEEALLRDMDALGEKLGRGEGGRWLAIARTHLELAFMAYNRAIFQPARVTGDFTFERVES